MAYTKVTSAACAALLLLGSQSFGQTTPAPRSNQGESKDAVALFDAAASKHKRELQNLLMTRGMPHVHLRDTTSASVARVLSVKSGEHDYEAGYPTGTAILFYSYEGGQLRVWLLDERGVRAYAGKDVSRDFLGTAINNLRLSLGAKLSEAGQDAKTRGAGDGAARRSRARLDESITALTEILIPPAVAAALPAVKHLIVVPVLELGTVPYALLRPFGSEAFLIDRMSVSVAPSLFDVGQSIERWRPEFDSPLVVGNPHLPPASGYDPLAGAEAEAKEVAKTVGATPMLGRRATKQAVLSRAPGADFLYFAAHGMASGDDPLSGGYLVLSAEQGGRGHLTAKEVQSMNLSGAKIAVLSACRSGLGKTHEAGVIGLARAFQLAGAPRVVMSLWKVEDEPTNELMRTFVKRMKDNVPAEALRLAMMDARQKHPEPSQWAAFVLFGTPR